jgi:hypothetical protein
MAISGAVAGGLARRSGGGGEVEKRQFVQRVLELIHVCLL